jgi:U2 small nuclear ribonucleoprotein auxiliary factor 35 kDa subunit-related protein
LANKGFFNILQFTDEEIEQSYEEFYDDVHTEFLKFGELANFKVPFNFFFVFSYDFIISTGAMLESLLHYFYSLRIIISY